MRQKIIRNLFLSVDYQREKSFSGILLNKHKFYLIGSLPVLFIWADGSKEASKIMTRVEIPVGDPNLRNILGARAVDEAIAKKYSVEIMSMATSIMKSIETAVESKVFAGKPLKSISIVNFSDGPKKNESPIITK